jgi:DNA-damage-inducible protein J
MAEIVIPIAIDEQAKKDADAVFKRFDLTASQLCSLILTRLAADKFNNKEEFALLLWKYVQGVPPPIIPNEETVAALEAARRGELKSFATIEELLADLNSDADD